jgi:hypothetical protein
MDVIPLPTAPADGAATATCAGCGAPLAPDQRYCLACGRPCSPVRLAFLDVLQAEPQTAAMPILGAPQAAAGYAAPPDPPGVVGSLRRYSGLFGLLGVLLAALLIGLLVGHWLTGSSSPGKQVFEVKGLSGLGAAAPAPASTAAGGAGTSTGPGSSSSNGHHGASTGSGSSQSHNAAKSEGGVEESSSEEAKAAKEAASPKALPTPSKVSPATQKIAHTTGKQHAKEVKEQGDEPIETH